MCESVYLHVYMCVSVRVYVNVRVEWVTAVWNVFITGHASALG